MSALALSFTSSVGAAEVQVTANRDTGFTFTGADDALRNSATITRTNPTQTGAVVTSNIVVQSLINETGGVIQGGPTNGAAVDLTDFGTVGTPGIFSNAGTISAAGGSGGASPAAALLVRNGTVGTFTNSGTMSSAQYSALYFGYQFNTVNVGTFTNATNGSITSSNDDTVFIGGAVTTFNNQANATISNTSNATNDFALYIRGATTTFTNAGSITAGGSTAVELRGGVGAGTNSGTISTNGSAQQALLIGGSNNAFTNAGTIRAGTNGTAIEFNGGATGGNVLTLMTGSTTTGKIIGSTGAGIGVNADTFRLAGTGNSSIAVDTVSLFEKLEKTSTGTWTLNGANTEFLAAAISAGLLSVNGDMRNMNVTFTGGTLGGVGRVGNVTVASGAAVAPGNSVGTLTVNDIIFSNGSIYNIEVSGGTADKIVALGTATLQSTTNWNIIGASAACGSSTFTVLDANTLVGGTGNINATGAGTWQLNRVGNSIQLTVTGGTGRTFSGFTNTANQASTAAALDALGCGNQPYASALNALTDAQVPAAMDALSGEGHASIAAAMLQNANVISGMVGDRLDQVMNAADAGIVSTGNGAVGSLLDPGVLEGLDVWGKSYGVVTQRDGNGNAATTRSVTGGFLVGAERDLGDDWVGGLMAGIGVTGISACPTSGQSVDATIGAYAGTEIGVVRLKGGVAYARHFISTSRSVVFPGVNDTLTASYGAGTGQAFIEASTDVQLQDMILTPFGRLEAVGHATDAFTETGGAGALKTAATQSGALFTTIGVRAEQSFVLGDDLAVRARGSLGWRHAFGGGVSVANSFAGGGPFTIASAGVASDAILLAAGLSTKLDEFTTLDLDYSGELGPGLASSALKLTIAGSF